jgi:hypothetical protein
MRCNIGLVCGVLCESTCHYAHQLFLVVLFITAPALVMGQHVEQPLLVLPSAAGSCVEWMLHMVMCPHMRDTSLLHVAHGSPAGAILYQVVHAPQTYVRVRHTGAAPLMTMGIAVLLSL